MRMSIMETSGYVQSDSQHADWKVPKDEIVGSQMSLVNPVDGRRVLRGRREVGLDDDEAQKNECVVQ